MRFTWALARRPPRPAATSAEAASCGRCMVDDVGSVEDTCRPGREDRAMKSRLCPGRAVGTGADRHAVAAVDNDGAGTDALPRHGSQRRRRRHAGRGGKAATSRSANGIVAATAPADRATRCAWPEGPTW
ncbi:MAG: hypothetical protein MZV64_15350 [Ignavibacteriales bacterium]|nr:hypothetical protein [Ignavibacteriales bacterium]